MNEEGYNMIYIIMQYMYIFEHHYEEGSIYGYLTTEDEAKKYCDKQNKLEAQHKEKDKHYFGYRYDYRKIKLIKIK